MKAGGDDDGLETPRSADKKDSARPETEPYRRNQTESAESRPDIEVEWTPEDSFKKPPPAQEPEPAPQTAQAPASPPEPEPPPQPPPASQARPAAAPRRFAAARGGWWSAMARTVASGRPGRTALAVLAAAALCGWLTNRLVFNDVEVALEVDFRETATALAWSDAGELYVGGANGSAAVFDAGGRLLRMVGPPASRVPLGPVAAILPAPPGDAANRKAVFVYPRPGADGDPLGFVRWLDVPSASDPNGAPLTLPSFPVPERLVAFFDDGGIVAGERPTGGIREPVTRLVAVAGAASASAQKSPKNRAAVKYDKGIGAIALLAPVPRSNMLLAASEDGVVYEVTSDIARGPAAGYLTRPGARPAGGVTALGVFCPPVGLVKPLIYGAVGGLSGRLTFLAASATHGPNVVTTQLPASSAVPPPRVDDIRLAADGRTALVRGHDGGLFAAFVEGATALKVRAPIRLATPPAHSALLTPDGARFVMADASDILRVYSLSREDGAVAEIAEIHGHGDVVHLMALSPDGRRVASASLDGRLRLTDIDLAARFFRWPLFATLAAPPPPRMPAYVPPVQPQSQKAL